jgi:hypothetical protein
LAKSIVGDRAIYAHIFTNIVHGNAWEKCPTADGDIAWCVIAVGNKTHDDLLSVLKHWEGQWLVEDLL